MSAASIRYGLGHCVPVVDWAERVSFSFPDYLLEGGVISKVQPTS